MALSRLGGSGTPSEVAEEMGLGEQEGRRVGITMASLVRRRPQPVQRVVPSSAPGGRHKAGVYGLTELGRKDARRLRQACSQ